MLYFACMKLIYGLLFFLNLLALNAQAFELLEDDGIYENYALAIPELLIHEFGQDGKDLRIGDLRLRRLRRQIKNEVHWLVNPFGFFLGSGEERASAIYYVEEEAVVINQMDWTHFAKPEHEIIRMLLACHEAIGALGYISENYQFCFSLFLNTSSGQNLVGLNDSFDTFLVGLKRRKKGAIYISDGGATSVGGGGDLVPVYVKFHLLRAIRHLDISEQGKIREIIVRILNAKIETNPSIDNPPLVEIRKDSQTGETSFIVSSVAWKIFGPHNFNIYSRTTSTIFKELTGLDYE